MPLYAGGGAVVAFLAIGLSIGLYPHYFGATEADIANANLAQPAQRLAGDLPASKVTNGRVSTRFRHSVEGFEQAVFSYRGGSSHVTGIRIVLEHERGKHDEPKKSERGDESWAKRLETRLPCVDHGVREWGAVRFEVSDDELSFHVDPGDGFEKKVEAARQVLLAVAFSDEPKLAPRELADALGTGYAVSDVAGVQVALPAITKQFPAAVAHAGYVRIPLSHPFVCDVGIGLERTGIHVDLHMAKAYRGDHKAFGACLAKQPIAMALEVRTQDVAVRDNIIDAATYASILQALDACR